MMEMQSAAFWLLPLLLQATLGTVLGIVDTSRPDLSGFKLRHVDTRELARQRLGKPITDLATGALHMHESLFVETSQVKCPAYAHLFKLIKRQKALLAQGPEALGYANMIRQSFVETLAVVVTYDRIVYHELFLRTAPTVSADHFVEAVELLESDHEASEVGPSQHQGAWLDLMECLTGYMAGRVANARANELLRDSARQRRLSALAKFRSIPVRPPPAPKDGDDAPEGLVRNLANRYEEGIQKRRLLSAEELAKANRLIEQLEDEGTRALKFQLTVEQQELERIYEAADSDGDGEEDGLGEENRPEQETNPAGDELEIAVSDRVEIVVPSPPAQEQPADSGKEHNGAQHEHESDNFREAQVAILKFIRMRLEQEPAGRFERAPRVSMQLAFDFSHHWDDLLAAQRGGELVEGTALARHAAAFLAENQRLAERVHRAIGTYVVMAAVLEEMRQREGQYKSLDELRLPLDRLTRLLDSMDASFDVDDLRRLHSIWVAKYTEYSTIERFIESESW